MKRVSERKGLRVCESHPFTLALDAHREVCPLCNRAKKRGERAVMVRFARRLGRPGDGPKFSCHESCWSALAVSAPVPG